MSDLLTKAKQLMNETGCSLPEAAQALREANEDYDLAMALINDKKGAVPAPSVDKPASAPQVQQASQPTYNQPYQPRPVNPANVEFKVPMVGNYITIALGVFLLLGGIAGFFIMNAMAADYDTTILEILSGNGPLYGSDIIISMLPTMIVLILFGIMSIILPIIAIKNYKRNIDTLKEIKAQFPDVLDPIIFGVYRISKKDKEKTIAMLRSKSGVLNAKFNNFNNKDVGNIVGVFFLLILAVAGWCIAAFTYDPEVNKNFEVPQIVGVIVAFIFLIAGVVFMIKTVKNAKSQAAKGYTLFFGLAMIATGAAVPAINGEKYAAFVGTLLGYILGIFVVIIILGALFGGKGKSSGGRSPIRGGVRGGTSFNSYPEESRSEPNRQFNDEPAKPEELDMRKVMLGKSISTNGGEIAGRVSSEGFIINRAGEYIGKITSDGYVLNKAGEITSKIDKNGWISDGHGNYAGKIDENGYISDKYGNSAGKAR